MRLNSRVLGFISRAKIMRILHQFASLYIVEEKGEAFSELERTKGGDFQKTLIWWKLQKGP